MTQLFTLLGKIFAKYTAAQRLVLGVVFIGILSVTISLVLWANRPEFSVLYTDLDATNASRILGDLQGMKIRYEIRDNGKTILVPKENMAELRLRFAESGYVGPSISGYELFDDQSLGMTTFMQQLNMRRALEGELTKTINQFPGVKNSRVHLVLPEERLFESDGNASASVVLDLVVGRYVDDDQVKGIASLVANSVEGLESNNVVIVDTEGNLLTDGQGEESMLGSTGTQWELRQAVERKLEAKVRDLVEGIVGPRNAVVEVAVEMNFEKIERTLEQYDPENVVVVSEERHTESSTNRDTTQNVNTSHENEDVITNYELNKTVEHYVANTGTVQRQTIAVLVNGTYTETEDADGNLTRSYTPRSKKELNQIAALVRSAVGHDNERGDLVEVQNVEFDRSSMQDDLDYFAAAEAKELQASLINKGLLVAAILAAFFIIRGLMKSLSSTIELPVLTLGEGGAEFVPRAMVGGGGAQAPGLAPGPEGQPAPQVIAPEPEVEISEDAYIAKLSPEARAKLKAKDRMTEEVVNYSKEAPEDTAKLLRTWMANNRA